MRRAGRIIFGAAALASLMMLVFVAWLTWSGGRQINRRPVEASGTGGRVSFGVQVGKLSNDYPWSWDSRFVRIGLLHIFGDESDIAYVVIAPALAFSLASIMPALWLVLRVTRRRRLAGRGFDVQPPPASQ